MPKIPRITLREAEKMLVQAGFSLIRSKGSHRIYCKGSSRFILPYHKGRVLHPKIVKQLIEIIERE